MTENNPEKKKKGRRAYLNDFKLQDSGTYAYEGKIFECTLGGAEFHKMMIRLWTLFGVMAGVNLLAGFLPHTGLNGNYFVVIPYAIELGCLVTLGFSLARLQKGGRRLREYVYRASVEKLPVRSSACMVTGVIAAAGMLWVFLSGRFEGVILYGILFLLSQAAEAGTAALFLKTCSAMQWDS